MEKNENTDETTESKLPLILSGKFFAIVREDSEKDVGSNTSSNKLVAKCLNCGQKLSGQRNATTNFKTHLKRMHPSAATEYERDKISHKRTRNQPMQQSSATASKQTTLTSSSWSGRPRPGPKLTQAELDANICHYITEELLPLSTVEAPSFIKLLAPMLREAHNEITMMSRRTLGRHITTGFNAMFNDIKSTFKAKTGKTWICLTTDIWSVNNKSFLGVTAHWINDNFTRSSAALACRRMPGSHDYKAIAKALNSVMQEFGIKVSEVSAVVTDNASNFSKTFKEYAQRQQEPELDNETEDLNDDADENIGYSDVDLRLVVEAAQAIAADSEEDDIDMDMANFCLPPQERCAAHLLNLVGSKDAIATDVLDKHYTSAYNTSFGKAQAIWNKYSRSSKAADAAKQACGRAIKLPGETRWNSKWDAVNVLLEINSDKKLNDVCRSIELPVFKQSEIDFLIEWARINKPLATTLDSLQGDKESYYGMLLPKLSVLVYELTKLSETASVVTKSLVAAILDGVRSRFPILDLQQSQSKCAILAAVSNPMYKLRWVTMDQRNDVQRIFTAAIRRVHNASMHCMHNAVASNSITSEETDEFHMFRGPDVANTNINSAAVDIEVANYLANGSKELSMLQLYPSVRQLFLETNTTLPSSAAVERLFSAGGLIYVPRRNRLSDNMFEQLLLLKANKYTYQ